MDDKRREVRPNDYKRIQVYTLVLNETNRQVAGDFQVSTKYVKKLLTDEAPSPRVGWSVEKDVFRCSGCGRPFSEEPDFLAHLDLWTSGGTRPLECWSICPNHPKLAELR